MSEIQVGLFVCARHVENNFPQKNEIYACGYSEPIKAWIAIKEIRAGQPLVVAKRGAQVSLYIIGKDGGVMQISGIYDLLVETQTIHTKTSKWVILSKMIEAIVRNCFDELSINELIDNKEDLIEFEKMAYEHVLEIQCRSWMESKVVVKDIIDSLENKPLAQKLLKGWSKHSRPSMKELNRPLIINKL